MKKTVQIVEDHTIVRQALVTMINTFSDFEAIGEAEDGEAALRMVETQSADILILDLMIPKINGIELTEIICRKPNAPKIVILSMHSDEEYVKKAMRYGASGYVTKDASFDELQMALTIIGEGGRYLSSQISDRAISSYVEADLKPSPDDANPCDALTKREKEILLLVSEGLTNAQVATRLVVSPRTVESHRANLMRKLGLHSASCLISFALQHKAPLRRISV